MRDEWQFSQLQWEEQRTDQVVPGDVGNVAIDDVIQSVQDIRC